MTGSGHVDNDIEMVRRGFDPSQVQQLVGQLSGELKTMAAENDQLRARVAELEASARPVPTTSNDIFTHWSKETNDLMDAARASIRSVTERATADAAAALAAGETAATAIRQRAQIDAEGILAEARRQRGGDRVGRGRRPRPRRGRGAGQRRPSQRSGGCARVETHRPAEPALGDEPTAGHCEVAPAAVDVVGGRARGRPSWRGDGDHRADVRRRDVSGTGRFGKLVGSDL